MNASKTPKMGKLTLVNLLSDLVSGYFTSQTQSVLIEIRYSDLQAFTGRKCGQDFLRETAPMLPSATFFKDEGVLKMFASSAGFVPGTVQATRQEEFLNLEGRPSLTYMVTTVDVVGVKAEKVAGVKETPFKGKHFSDSTDDKELLGLLMAQHNVVIIEPSRGQLRVEIVDVNHPLNVHSTLDQALFIRIRRSSKYVKRTFIAKGCANSECFVWATNGEVLKRLGN